MRDERDSLEPDAEAPAELEERVVFGVGVHKDRQEENRWVDPEVVVEVVRMLVVALGDSRLRGSRVF